MKRFHLSKTVIGSTLVGFISTFSFYLYTLPEQTWIQRVFLLFYVFVLSSASTYFIYKKIIAKLLRQLPYSVKGLLLLNVFLTGLIVTMVPVAIPEVPEQRELIIEVATSGQSSALGTEVWVNQIQVDGRTIPESEITLHGEWKSQNGVLFSNHPGDRLQWSGLAHTSFDLAFVSHPWSGAVILTSGQASETIELFAESPGYQKPVFLDLASPPTLLELSGFVAFACLLYLLVFLTTVLLLRYLPEGFVTVSKGERYLWWLLPFIAYVVYYLSYYPANMSFDSLSQWAQIQSNVFEDWHPVMHTFLLWMIAKIWNSPAAFAISQLTAMSIVIGFLSYRLRNYGTPVLFAILTVGYFSLSPVHGMMSITVWKDIPFALVMTLLTYVLFVIYKSNGNWLASNKNVVLLIIILLLVSGLRHNGILPYFGTVLGLFLFYYRIYKRLFIVSIVSLILVLGMKGPIYEALDVKTTPPQLAFSFYLHQVGSMVHEGIPLRDEEIAVLDPILPIEKWGGPTYHKYSANYIIFDPEFSSSAFTDLKFDFIKLWFSLALKHPKLAFTDWANMTSIVRVVKQPQDGYTYTMQRGVLENNQGLQTSSYLPSVKNVIDRAVTFTEIHKEWFWRPAFFLLLTIIFGVLFMFRERNWRATVILIPVLMEAGGLLLTAPAQDARYFYSTMIMAPFIIMMFFTSSASKTYDRGSAT